MKREKERCCDVEEAIFSAKYVSPDWSPDDSFASNTKKLK